MGHSRRTSIYSERATLSNPTHMMSMADPMAIAVETSNGWIMGTLRERVHFTKYESLDDIILNCQSG